MSCASAKTDAKTALDAATYTTSASHIGPLENTNATNVTLTNVRGKITASLTNYTSTNTGAHSLMILATQRTSDGPSNVPSPIVVNNPATWNVFTTVFALGTTVTIPATTSINDQSINFTIATCGADTTKGWSIEGQQFILAITRKKTATVVRS